MKKLTSLLLLILISTFNSCSKIGSSKLPNNLLELDSPYQTFKDKIAEHYDKKIDALEVMEFYYSSSVNSKNEISSYASIKVADVTDKNKVVEFYLNNDSHFTKNGVDISIGRVGKEKRAKKYEEFQSFLFPDEHIDFSIIKKLVLKAKEMYSKDTNIDNARCESISVERNNRGKLCIGIRISEFKFVGGIDRSYTWNIDGTKML